MSRFPGFLLDVPLNTDETIILAAALTAEHRGWLPWRDFDTTTIGPLPTWIVAAAISAGAPPGYYLMHSIAALLWAATGVVVLRIIKLSCGPTGSRIALLLLLAASILSWRADYLHLTSETLPNFLLTGAGLMIAGLVRRDTANGSSTIPTIRFFIVGVLCAAAIVAKLQSLPIACFLCLASLLACQSGNRRCWLITALAVGAGVLLPIALLIGWLAAEETLLLAFQSYLLGGASHGLTQLASIMYWLKLFYHLLNGWWTLQAFFVAILLALFLAVRSGWRPWPFVDPQAKFAWLFGGWLAAALFSVVVPSFRFEHHGVFLLPPATLLLSYLTIAAVSQRDSSSQNALENPSSNPWKATIRRQGLTVAAIFLTWFTVAGPRMSESIRFPSGLPPVYPSAAVAEVMRLVETYASPGDPIAVWGWAPEIFVLGRRPSATRHIISHYLIDAYAVRQVHRATFLEDVTQELPQVIIDAVAPGFFTWYWASNYEANRISSAPEIAAFINANYCIAEGADLTGEVRPIVYIRRMSESTP